MELELLLSKLLLSRTCERPWRRDVPVQHKRPEWENLSALRTLEVGPVSQFHSRDTQRELPACVRFLQAEHLVRRQGNNNGRQPNILSATACCCRHWKVTDVAVITPAASTSSGERRQPKIHLRPFSSVIQHRQLFGISSSITV